MTLDYYKARMSGQAGAGGSQEHVFGAELMGRLSLEPSEYWARQCHVGSSFIRRDEVEMRHAVGVDRIMWGSDFPHREGCWPYSHEHLRLAFAGVDPVEVAAMVGGNAAGSTASTSTRSRRSSPRIGPSVDEVAEPLPADDIPDDALRCPAFALAAMTGQAAGGTP